MNIFSPHMSFEELADLADGHSTLSTEAAEHLSGCSQCSRQLQTIQQTIGSMRLDIAENAPAERVQYAKNAFRERGVIEKPSLFRRVVASLTFDSLTAAPAFGLRSEMNAARQLVYATETAYIDVRVSPDNDEWEITGQILGSSCASGDVNLEGDSFSASVELNEVCDFSISAVPNGNYKIFVRLPDLVIETPQFELGP